LREAVLHVPIPGFVAANRPAFDVRRQCRRSGRKAQRDIEVGQNGQYAVCCGGSSQHEAGMRLYDVGQQVQQTHLTVDRTVLLADINDSNVGQCLSHGPQRHRVNRLVDPKKAVFLHAQNGTDALDDVRLCHIPCGRLNGDFLQERRVLHLVVVHDETTPRGHVFEKLGKELIQPLLQTWRELGGQGHAVCDVL